jgi:hypothetical protein
MTEGRSDIARRVAGEHALLDDCFDDPILTVREVLDTLD